jgi:surface-anchored protein
MQGAVQNRIVGGAGATKVALPKSVSPKVSKATDLGDADGSLALSSMTLRFNMTDAQKAALTQLLSDQQNPVSTKYHQWLTPEQFADQFGVSSGDMATVSQWLTSQGFKITAAARGRTFIQFSGTVAQAQTAFQTSIHRVSLNGEEHVANVTAASLPSGIAGVVGSVAGLNDFRLVPRARVHSQVQVDPKFTDSKGNHYIAPGDFYTIYDVKPLLASSINGSGITIAVAGQTDISLTDVSAFRSATGLSANLPTVKLYGTDPGTRSGDIDEAQLDVEWSGAVAPSASILYVNSTNVIDSLLDIIDNNLAPIASISYGDCESGYTASDINTLNQSFMQANAQGITVVGPAGDSGATDCDYTSSTATKPVTSATHGLAVDFPASSPYVTGMGGTMFNEGSASYFSTTNDSNGGSAISYIPEAVWNETSASIAAGYGLSAGGGGVSSVFTKPTWQTGTGVPNDFARDVPDLSLNAAASHDGYLVCTEGSCGTAATTGCPTGGCFAVYGGTSVSTPAFAGILALVQQKIGAATANANPTIYALANSAYYGTVFHDVTTGNNDSPCTAGTTNCPTGGSIGYSATTGYDQATGWGSVDAFVLANSWTLVTSGGGTTSGETSTTTVGASSASVTSGTSVTITATVANGGTTTESASPTGTVQFLVDNVASGAAVTLSGGVATFSLATTGLTSGNHVVSAAYSGDSVYAASKGSVTIDVVSASVADFALTPATATVTTKSGTDASGLVFTVTPSNGFTGSVAFSASTTSTSLNATYSFSVTPVVISSTTAGTTTLTLSAYSVNAQAVKGQLRVRPAASSSAEPPAGARRGWIAGSGAALACVVLLMVPRRRKFGALLGAVIAVAALGGMLGMSGCGGGTSTIGTTGGNTNTTPGTYTINVTATGTNAAGTVLTHNATVTFVVQ